MLAAIIDVSHIGYPVLFVLVMAESSGVPVPGETGLIAAGVLASKGSMQIEVVIAIAALGAIVGDNIGYVIGRRGGRWLLERPGRYHSQRLQALRSGEVFFERHGPKAVFLGRFFVGLRIWASWLAGATHMRWRSFFFWNAVGGICWATAIGLLAYFIGHAAGNAIQTFGLFGLAAAVVAIVLAFVAHRRHQRRVAAKAANAATAADGPPAYSREKDRSS
jgi:membrane protein DedA with SNARE-associated domain